MLCVCWALCVFSGAGCVCLGVVAVFLLFGFFFFFSCWGWWASLFFVLFFSLFFMYDSFHIVLRQ